MKAWSLVAAIGVLLTGCPAPKPNNESTTGVANEAARPALRVRIQADEALCELVSRQWKSISEQPIEVVPITAAEIAADKLPAADVVVFESRWLPTWAERDGLVPLPKSMLESEGKEGNSTSESPSISQSMVGDWSVTWKASADYGKRTWGYR